jgi:hypothetical protein
MALVALQRENIIRSAAVTFDYQDGFFTIHKLNITNLNGKMQPVSNDENGRK